MRVGWRDVVIAVGTLAILLAALVALDDRVRIYTASVVHGATSSNGASHAGMYVRDAAWVVFVAARDQSLAHGPLVIFVTAASVLVVFMLRT